MNNLSPMGYACNLYQKGCQIDPCIHGKGFDYLEMERCQLLVLAGLMLTKVDEVKNIMNSKDQLSSLANQFLQRYEKYKKEFGKSREWKKIQTEIKPVGDLVQRIIFKLSLDVRPTDWNEYKNTRKSLKKIVEKLKDEMEKFDSQYTSSSDTL